jgi:small subunit ribosomal protein S1
MSVEKDQEDKSLDDRNEKSLKEDSEEPEDFSALYEAYSAGIREQLEVGDKIRGEIIAIGHDSIFIDTGTKIDGVVDKKELLNSKGQLPFSQGDSVELFVIATGEGEVRLSKALSGIGGRQMLVDAFRNRIPVEGRVSGTCKGGYNVDVMKQRAFCPLSQVDIKYVETPEDHIGQTYLFYITQIEEMGRNIVLSRRKLLEQEREKARKEFLNALSTGIVLSGTVTRLMPYGVFVELIPGIEGMVHISELSWSRLNEPSETVHAGDSIQVKVLGIDSEKGPGSEKISLSVKQLLEDPWENASDRIIEGDIFNGRVKRCTNFGAFVEIEPGIEGLVHISEMSYIKRVLKPEDMVSPGDEVAVLVKSLDLEKRRVSLSIRDAEGDPWQDVSEKYKVGQVVSGTMEKAENFGYFISLEPGITGLMPKSKVSQSAEQVAISKLKTGDAIEVTIENVDRKKRRITLMPGEGAERGEWRQFRPAESSTMGELGQKLKKALEDRKKK